VKLFTEYVFGWQEERDVAYFPAIAERARGKGLLLGWLGTAVKWSVATALLSSLSPCGSNPGPDDGQLSIKIMSIMIFVVLLVCQGGVEESTCTRRRRLE